MLHSPQIMVKAPAATAGIVAFTPTSIAGLQMWLDFTDSGTVTLVSGNISQINDKSGSGGKATQSTAGNRPGYSALCPNGSNAGGFSGSKWLIATGFTCAQPFTFIIVGKSSVSGFLANNPSMVFADSQTIGGLGNYLFGWVASGNGNGDTVTVDLNVDLVATFIGSGASSQMFINGVQRGTTGQGSATTGFATASPLAIGTNQGLSFPMNGYIAHVLVYNSALGSTDRTSLNNYLKTSTGITF